MRTEMTYFEKIGRLTELGVKNDVSLTVLDEVLELISDNDVRRHFLGMIGSPSWIAPLLKAGLFRHPIPVRRQGTLAQYPSWPESQYLARMASQSAAEVASILSTIRTDNPSIIRDMLMATASMPVSVSSVMVPQICRAALDGALWLYFKDASDFCVRLAKGGQSDSAVELANALFEPIILGDDKHSVRRQDEYWYKVGLKEVVPALLELKPKPVLISVCGWLENLVKVKEANRTSFDDFSYIWRPAIEDHEENYDSHLAAVMVGVARQAFEQAVESGGVSLHDALSLLDRYQYLVFRRLRLYLIAKFGGQDSRLVRQQIVDRSLFDNYMFKHEYAYLVGRHFGLLSGEEKSVWFGWVDEGPDLTGFEERVKEGLKRNATDADRQARIRYWQFEKLHLIREYLGDERKRFYNEMLDSNGAPDMADLNVRSGGAQWGYQSPISLEALSELAFEEAVESLVSWDDKGALSTLEGRASTFEQFIARDPEVSSKNAEILIGRPPIFVRSFISQMSKAVKDGRNIDVERVLRLCTWVTHHTVWTTEPVSSDPSSHREWQWTRDEISQLIQNICIATYEDLPKYALNPLRDPIWELISELYRDVSDSNVSDDEADGDPRLSDYLMRGINSSQGKAVEAALEYARWIANHNKKPDAGPELVSIGFEVMPEVRDMLEHLIRPRNRRVETLSIIGSRMNLIYWIDSEWLRMNAQPLFSLEAIADKPASTDGWAAWNSFLVWVPPHVEYYRLFKSQYAYAVEQARSVSVEGESLEQPMYRLGEHLISLYGRGFLGLDDDGALFRRFVENASPSIRRHALTFAGQRIGSATPDEVIERLRILWETYWAGPGKSDAEDRAGAWLFGSWFSSGAFNERWALERLEEFVAVMPIAEPEVNVVKRLKEIAHVNMAQSVRILTLMAKGDKEGWRIQSWIDSARIILADAMKQTGEPRERAVELINYLGRLGHDEMGALLRT